MARVNVGDAAQLVTERIITVLQHAYAAELATRTSNLGLTPTPVNPAPGEADWFATDPRQVRQIPRNAEQYGYVWPLSPLTPVGATTGGALEHPETYELDVGLYLFFVLQVDQPITLGARRLERDELLRKRAEAHRSALINTTLAYASHGPSPIHDIRLLGSASDVDFLDDAPRFGHAEVAVRTTILTTVPTRRPLP